MEIKIVSFKRIGAVKIFLIICKCNSQKIKTYANFQKKLLVNFQEKF